MRKTAGANRYSGCAQALLDGLQVENQEELALKLLDTENEARHIWHQLEELTREHPVCPITGALLHQQSWKMNSGLWPRPGRNWPGKGRIGKKNSGGF